MAFSPFNTTEISASKANTQDLWSKIKDDFDDHESRLLSVESGSAVSYPPMILALSGFYGEIIAANRIITQVNFGLLITGAKLIVHTAGSSGTTQVDLKKKSGASSPVSIYSTLPSLAFGAGDFSQSTNQILNVANTTLLANDFLILDLTSSQVDSKNCFVRIDYTKT